MQRVLSNYEKGDEVEIRYYLDPRARHPAECLPAKYPAGFQKTVERILEKLGGVAAARHTRIIDLQLGTLRKRITFNQAGERQEEWIDKVHKADWVEPNDFGGFKVAVSREQPSQARKMPTLDRVTVKSRLTFALDVLGMPAKLTDAQRENRKTAGPDGIPVDDPAAHIDSPWVVDVSAVKVCTLGNIQDAKTKLLACYNPLENWGWWDHWEFERELTQGMSGDDMTCNTPSNAVELLELDDIYQTYTIFAPSVDHDMLDAVRRLALMIDHPRATQYQRLSPRNTITRLLPKAVEPTLETWIEDYAHLVRGMVLRDKIDGTRELVWIRSNKLVCISAKSIDEWDEPATDGASFVFDCEFLDDVWYVIHPLVWRGRSVTHMRDTERLALLSDKTTGLASLGVDGLAVCPYRVIDDPKHDISSMWNRKARYHRDGLIACTDEPYFTQKCLKWKPADESTLDMLIVECPDWLMGKAPFIREEEGDTVYMLNVGANSSTVAKKPGFPMKRYLDMLSVDKSSVYIPTPFAPDNMPHAYVWSTSRAGLGGNIGEFIWLKRGDTRRDDTTATRDGWELRRLRDDKPSIMRGGTEIGNDIKTALDIWSKNDSPFPLKYLWEPPAKRASRFDELDNPVARIVADLVEEEAVTTAVVHMCPFVPFDGIAHRGVLLPRAATGVSAGTDYRADLSNNSRVHQIIYDQIGRVDLPKDFLGGVQLLVTMDPELLGHVSCLGKLVAAGGRLVVICRFAAGEDAHPEVGRVALLKDMDRAGFVLLQDHGAPATTMWDLSTDWDLFTILSFRKENRGSADMSVADVHKENPHLLGNPEANFAYKFSRQKTKDIAGLIGPNEDCGSLQVRPDLGELLIDIEFLSTLEPDAQVLYMRETENRACDDEAVPDEEHERVEHLQRLFPKMQFRTTGNDTDGVIQASAENVEAVVSHCGYDRSQALIAKYEPHCGLLDICSADMRRHKIVKGRMMLHPYAALTSTRVSLAYGRARETWNILPDIFEQEMMMFHRVFRPSAFKCAVKRAGMDNCYDCRANIYIVTKYARAQKITLDEAYSRLGFGFA